MLDGMMLQPVLAATNEEINMEQLQQLETFAELFDMDVVQTALLVIAGGLALWLFLKPKITSWLNKPSFDADDFPMRSAGTEEYLGVMYEANQTEDGVRCASVMDMHGEVLVDVVEDDEQTICGFTSDKKGLYLHIAEGEGEDKIIRKLRFNPDTLEFDSI